MNDTKRKKPLILLLSDDLRLHSGIATMSREIVLNTVERFDWLQVAAAVNHPDKGKFFDISDSIIKETGIEDAVVRLIPNDGYGSQDLIRQILASERPDAILHFTDPRFWGWLYAMEDEIRNVCPLMYYSIWDDGPDPDYNHQFYGSCDAIFGISKQSYGIHHRIMKNNGGTVIPLDSSGRELDFVDNQTEWDKIAGKNLW